MAPLMENTPAIVEETIDFMASTYAFREYLHQAYPIQMLLDAIPSHQHPYFYQRLEHYRDIYQPEAAPK